MSFGPERECSLEFIDQSDKPFLGFSFRIFGKRSELLDLRRKIRYTRRNISYIFWRNLSISIIDIHVRDEGRIVIEKSNALSCSDFSLRKKIEETKEKHRSEYYEKVCNRHA